MDIRHIFPSLTRITNLRELELDFEALPKEKWSTGDYILSQVIEPATGVKRLEQVSGRMAEVMRNDLLIGALGIRHATLEATGSWKAVENDNIIHLLTAAGLMGKLTSVSPFVGPVVKARYLGHAFHQGNTLNMKDFIQEVPVRSFTTPVVLMVGTSMSAGKTTASRLITSQLKLAGLKVVAAKLTGAGRYRDILTVRDAGADAIYDFVDVGLPSTVVPLNEYKIALEQLLSRLAAVEADVAMIEIGASPLEPYNGTIAVKALADQIKCMVLCASDPYAALGVMKSFNMTPDIISGITTNTLAGKELAEKLCGVPALNLIDPETRSDLRMILKDKLKIHFPGLAAV